MSTKNINYGPDPETVAEAHRAKNEAKKQAGVVEGQPGIIETTDIDPLRETSNKDDGWANTKSKPLGQAGNYVSGAAATAAGLAETAANAATNAAKYAYGASRGDEAERAQKERSTRSST